MQPHVLVACETSGPILVTALYLQAVGSAAQPCSEEFLDSCVGHLEVAGQGACHAGAGILCVAFCVHTHFWQHRLQGE